MNLKKIITCSLLCGMLFSTIPAKAMDPRVNSDSRDTDVSVLHSDSFELKLSDLIEKLSNDSIPKDSRVMVKAYCDLVSLIHNKRTFEELTLIYNFLERLGDSNKVTKIAKSMCVAYMHLCDLKTEVIEELKAIIYEIVDNRLEAESGVYREFYREMLQNVQDTNRRFLSLARMYSVNCCDVRSDLLHIEDIKRILPVVINCADRDCYNFLREYIAAEIDLDFNRKHLVVL